MEPAGGEGERLGKGGLIGIVKPGTFIKSNIVCTGAGMASRWPSGLRCWQWKAMPLGACCGDCLLAVTAGMTAEKGFSSRVASPVFYALGGRRVGGGTSSSAVSLGLSRSRIWIRIVPQRASSPRSSTGEEANLKLPGAR